jgi:hypothetical protein
MLDAARYRWVRENVKLFSWEFVGRLWSSDNSAKECDELIDAELERE